MRSLIDLHHNETKVTVFTNETEHNVIIHNLELVALMRECPEEGQSRVQFYTVVPGRRTRKHIIYTLTMDSHGNTYAMNGINYTLRPGHRLVVSRTGYRCSMSVVVTTDEVEQSTTPVTTNLSARSLASMLSVNLPEATTERGRRINIEPIPHWTVPNEITDGLSEEEVRRRISRTAEMMGIPENNIITHTSASAPNTFITEISPEVYRTSIEGNFIDDPAFTDESVMTRTSMQNSNSESPPTLTRIPSSTAHSVGDRILTGRQISQLKLQDYNEDVSSPVSTHNWTWILRPQGREIDVAYLRAIGCTGIRSIVMVKRIKGIDMFRASQENIGAVVANMLTNNEFSSARMDWRKTPIHLAADEGLIAYVDHPTVFEVFWKLAYVTPPVTKQIIFTAERDIVITSIRTEFDSCSITGMPEWGFRINLRTPTGLLDGTITASKIKGSATQDCVALSTQVTTGEYLELESPYPVMVTIQYRELSMPLTHTWTGEPEETEPALSRVVVRQDGELQVTS